MNLENYIRALNEEGVDEFLITVRRLNSTNVRVCLNPIFKSQMISSNSDYDCSKEIVVKENSIGWNGKEIDLVGEFLRKSARKGEFDKIAKQVDSWFEHEQEYISEIIRHGFIILEKKGYEALKQYLDETDVDIMAGPNFKHYL